MHDMADTIYLLDFRRGRVEAIDESVPPRGVREAEFSVPAEEFEEGAGFMLTALGTPPESDEAL
jgi:hypothetical protein